MFVSRAFLFFIRVFAGENSAWKNSGSLTMKFASKRYFTSVYLLISYNHALCTLAVAVFRVAKAFFLYVYLFHILSLDSLPLRINHHDNYFISCNIKFSDCTQAVDCKFSILIIIIIKKMCICRPS